MIRALLTLVLCVVLPLAHASNVGVDWLSRMVNSFDTLSYEGVFVHQEAGTMNSMRIRHGLIGGVAYESLEDLDGQRIEVIRVDDSIICVYQDKEDFDIGLVANGPFKRFKKLDETRLGQAYDIRIADDHKRIASRQAVKLTLIPKDEYRYGHVFWVDVENGFLLKHDVLDNNGALLERIQFTAVNFFPDLKADDFAPKEGLHAEQFVKSEPESVPNRWQFEWLPQGFELVWANARKMNDKTNMMLLSDGMSTVSVFVEKSDRKRPQTLMNLGATIAGEKSIQVGEHTYLLTLVGEVPAQTIQRLMTVIMPKAEND